jgi:hypothetical protein
MHPGPLTHAPVVPRYLQRPPSMLHQVKEKLEDSLVGLDRWVKAGVMPIMQWVDRHDAPTRSDQPRDLA